MNYPITTRGCRAGFGSACLITVAKDTPQWLAAGMIIDGWVQAESGEPKAAVARIHLSQEPSKETLEAIRKSSDDILELTLLPL